MKVEPPPHGMGERSKMRFRFQLCRVGAAGGECEGLEGFGGEAWVEGEGVERCRECVWSGGLLLASGQLFQYYEVSDQDDFDAVGLSVR